MSEEIKFLPYEVALKIVGNVIEEEHIHEPNRRILTVYDKQGKELCWYDADEILAEATPDNPKDQDSVKAAAVEVIMRQIPVWAMEDVLKRAEQQAKMEKSKG
ncbi:MAG: hypothetical protein KKA54_14965 [Proteobacteria bacterium]|nr:hypothetical protein [Pseudomonadota bacterium]MBU0967670.1 hypothetical protein [Pseudomonadota bacterium]